MDKIHQIQELSNTLMGYMNSVEEKQNEIRKISQEIESIKKLALSRNATYEIGQIVEVHGDKYKIVSEPVIDLSELLDEGITWDIFYDAQRLKSDGSIYKNAGYGKNYRRLSQAHFIKGIAKPLPRKNEVVY